MCRKKGKGTVAIKIHHFTIYDLQPNAVSVGSTFLYPSDALGKAPIAPTVETLATLPTICYYSPSEKSQELSYLAQSLLIHH